MLFDGEKTTLISAGSGSEYPQVDIWPYKHMEIASNAPWLVHSWPDTFEGFKKRGLLSLVKETDLDGEPCYLLEGKGDNSPWRFWISKDKDYALVRWDVIHEGVLKIRWQMSDFRQVNGIWLAHHIIDRRPPKREEEGKIVTEEYITEVKEAAFNIPIPEETFKIEIAEGSLVKEHSPDDPREIVKTYRYRRPKVEEAPEKPLSPEEAALKEKLAQKMTFEAVDAPFSSLINLISRRADLNIVIDQSVVSPEGMRTPITLKVEEATIDSALKHILKQMGLDYVIKDGAVFISHRFEAMGEPTLAVYGVRELVKPIRDFEAPKLGVLEPGEEEKPLVLSAEEKEKEREKRGEELAKHIRDTIEPGIWWLFEENSVRYHDGQLIIRAPAPIQIKIQEFLENLRQERALKVLVFMRFLRLAPEFLEEIEKELKLELAPIAGVVSPPAEDIPVPSNLREDEVKALLKRVQKSEKAKIMTAPRITLFNSQRGYIAQIHEDDYIFDIRPVEGEPEKTEEIKKKVRTGFVFDVRPVISADRKYVLMDNVYVRLAEITGFKEVKAQTGEMIEVPEVEVFVIGRFGHRVPDGETVLLTPRKIPAKEGEEESALTELLVLVTPHIIIEVEEERVLKEEE